MLNMVKGLKLEVKVQYVKMLHESQKPRLQPTLSISLAKVPLLVHTRQQTAVRSVAFVAKVVPWFVCVTYFRSDSGSNMYRCI